MTILNDLCLFAPSRLIDLALSWTAVDDTRAKLAFTLEANTVSAELVFNAAGELIDFISDDRGALGKDGSLLIQRWTTPMTRYADFGDCDAIWHRPEGPFVYGHSLVTEYEAR